MAGAFFGLSVTVDTQVLDSLMGKSAPAASQLIRKHAYEFEADAKQHAPLDTGALRNSINVSELSDVSAVISDGVEYGVYQEFGVNHPYMIDSPVNIKGKWVYIKQHPGFAPQPFFTPAAEKVSSHFFTEYFPIWLAGV